MYQQFTTLIERGGVGKTITPSADIEADFALIREFYDTYGHGKYPENAGVVALPPKEK